MLDDLFALPENILDRISPEPNSGCWLWTGGTDDNGYGCIYMGGGRKHRHQDRAHRVVYQALAKPIPTGFWIDHLCRTPACCNPRHLEPVPPMVNVNRGDGPARASERMRLNNPAILGRKPPATTMKPPQIIKIRELAAGGLSQGKIGKMFGISQSSVSKIVRQLRHRSAA
jgi:hypothetical protein